MLKQITEILEIADLQGISQSEIARRLNVNQSSVSRTLGGIPALSSELIQQRKICDMLSVDEDFLSGTSAYPFLSSSFVKFKIKGLRARRRPYAWLDLLLNYSEKLKVFLLIQQVKERVEVACVKDDLGSIFLIFIQIPLSWKDFFDHVTEEKLLGRVFCMARPFFDYKTAGPYRSANDIAHFDRNKIDSLIEEAFQDLHSDDERYLIKIVRERKVPIKKLIELAERMDPNT